MKKTAVIFLFSILLSGQVQSDIREDNIDLFLVLDKSLSMVEEIEAVKDYVGDFLVDTFLINGDNLIIVNFYGKAETIVKTNLDNNTAKTSVLSIIDRIAADGRFTDIGNALDRLNREIENFPETGRKQYLLLITDGIQEAPPESVYWSEDGSFNHYFLENTKTIRKRGWKIQIIGIGSETAARLIAEELSGAYSEVSSDTELDKNELIKAASGMEGRIEPVSSPVFEAVDAAGNGVMNVSFRSVGYTDTQRILISGLYYSDQEVENWDLLAETAGDEGVRAFVDFTINPEEVLSFSIPVGFPPRPEEDVYLGAVYLTFKGNNSITPAYFEIETSVKKPFPLWIAVIAAAVLFTAVIAVIIFRSISGNKAPAPGIIDINCSVKGKRAIDRNFILGNEERIYIVEKGFGIDFKKSRESEMSRAFAYLYKDGDDIKMKNLKPDSFTTKQFLTGNMLEKELEFIVSGRDSLSFRFKKNPK